MKKQNNLILKIAGFILAIAGVALIIFGATSYSSEGHSINETDPAFKLILFGILGACLGFLFLINGFAEKAEETLTISQKTARITQAALFAALAYIGFQFFKIDVPVGPEKTAFHLGNVFVVLGALLLGGSWGGIAGAIGLTIADLTSGYVTSAPKTFLLKLCIGLITGFVAHHIFHITASGTSKKKITAATITACISGMVFNIIADPLVGYAYKYYLFGIPQDIAEALAKMSALTTSVNAILTVIASTILYTALRPILAKSGLLIRFTK